MKDEQKQNVVSKKDVESIIKEVVNKLKNEVPSLKNIEDREVLIARIKSHVRESMRDKIKSMKQQGITDCLFLDEHIQDISDKLDPILEDLKKSFLSDLIDLIANKNKLFKVISVIILILLVAIICLSYEMVVVVFNKTGSFLKRLRGLGLLGLLGLGGLGGFGGFVLISRDNIIIKLFSKLNRKLIYSKLKKKIIPRLKKKLRKELPKIINPSILHQHEKPTGKIRNLINKLPFIKSLTNKKKAGD